MNPAIAKRYARALIVAASDEAELTRFESELAALAECYEKSALKEFLLNPVFHVLERLDFVKTLGLEPKLERCLEMLIEGNRTTILPALSKAYQLELDAKLGRVRAQITSASNLSAEQISAITESLFSRLGKSVIAELHVEPRVMAGVRAQIGGLVFDNTVETQFSQLRRALCN